MRMYCATLLLALLASTAPAQDDLAKKLAGAWQRDEGGPELLGFFPGRCVIANGTQQQVYSVKYDAPDRIVRTPLADGPVLDTKVRVTMEGKRLTLTYTGGKEITYSRLADVPEAVCIDPFELGKRKPDEAERAAITKDLRRRGERDQAVRGEIGRLLVGAQRDAKSPDDYQKMLRGPAMQKLSAEMKKIDTDNTRHLFALVKDVGWIDSERFGNRACDDAFLIVQHSGNLRLMRTALPQIKVEAKKKPQQLGQLYALLYDRTTVALGGKQRYGSQLSFLPDGSLKLRELEDPERVDAWRAELGMTPLEKYLDLFRKRGQKVKR